MFTQGARYLDKIVNNIVDDETELYNIVCFILDIYASDISPCMIYIVNIINASDISS